MAANLPVELLAGAAGSSSKPNQSSSATDGHACQCAGADTVCIRVVRAHALIYRGGIRCMKWLL